MRIGLDLDNTIACLAPLFGSVATSMQLGNFAGKGKQAVKSALTDSDGSDLKWQKLQGQVYGAEYYRAKPYPSAVKTILEWCKQPLKEVYIVSHKTLYGHQDCAKVNLHQVALEWLNAVGIVGKGAIPESQVFFALSQRDKVQRITELECDFFVDDLSEILLHAEFPHRTSGLLFSPYSQESNQSWMGEQANNWLDIANYIQSFQGSKQ